MLSTAPPSKSIRTEPGQRKKGAQSLGKSRGGRNTKIHVIVANETMPIVFQLSPGSCHENPEGRKLIPKLLECYRHHKVSLLMDKAYEGDEVRALAASSGLKPVVPPKKNARNRGNMTAICTNDATKWSVFSDV